MSKTEEALLRKGSDLATAGGKNVSVGSLGAGAAGPGA